MQIENYISRKLIGCYEESDEKAKKLTLWAL